MAIDLQQVSDVSTEPGELPRTMAAWVIREERFGEPKDAFQLEEIEVPEPGAFEVIVRVMAAGVNYNNVWAALGTLLPHASPAQRGKLVDALGSGASGARLPGAVQDALSHTYVYALSNALYVAGGLALIGAVLAWLLVSARVAPARERVGAEPLPAGS